MINSFHTYCKNFNNHFFFKNNNLFIVSFVIYLIAISFLTTIYIFLITKIHPQYIDENYLLIIKNLGWENDLIILNLIESKEFKFTLYGTNFYSAKFPLLPLTIYFLSNISKNIFVILILKNLIFFSPIFATSYYFVKNDSKNLLHFIIILLVFHLNPYHFHIMSGFYFEDFANAIFIPLLYLILISNIKYKYFISGIYLSVLFLSKSSMTMLSYFLPFFILVVEYIKTKKIIISPFLIISIPILAWGFHGYINSGKFPFFLQSSSYNQAALSIALQKDFIKTYPKYTVDSIDIIPKIVKEKHKYKFQDISNEWEFNNLFKKRNLYYLKNNYTNYLESVLSKINFIFFYPYEDSKSPLNKEKKIKFSIIFNKLFLFFGYFFSIILFIKNFFEKKLNICTLYYIFIINLVIPIYIVGWATSKHLVGISILSILFLLNKFYKFSTRN